MPAKTQIFTIQKSSVSGDSRSANPNKELADLGTLDMGTYCPGEEEAILECLTECFGFDPDLHKWQHLYLHNPSGEPIILVARHRDRIISHLAVVPRRIRAFDEEGLAGHSIDAATRPEWQRKGIKTKLAIQAKQMARERGFLMNYGFSNEKSSHGAFKYEGRTPVRSLPVLVRPLPSIQASLAFAGSLLHEVRLRIRAAQRKSLIPEAAVAGPLPVAAAYSRKALSPEDGWTLPSFDERHTQLFQRAESIPPIALVRDSIYLNWRYASLSESPYLHHNIVEGSAVVATVVVRFVTLFGLHLMVIMEWFWRQGERRKGLGLLRKTLKLARNVNAHCVTALAMPGTLQRRLLKHKSFIAIPNILLPNTTILGVRPERKDVDKTRWSAPGNWYLTWGDGFLL